MRVRAGGITRRLVTATVTCFSLGCYTSVPLPTARPAVGSRVVVVLTDAGAEAMAAQLGPSKRELTGDVRGATDTSLVLALRTVTTQRNIDEIWNGEQVVVPRSAVASMGSRRVSARRSIVLALVLSVAAVALAAAIGVGGLGLDKGADDGSTQ